MVRLQGDQSSLFLPRVSSLTNHCSLSCCVYTDFHLFVRLKAGTSIQSNYKFLQNHMGEIIFKTKFSIFPTSQPIIIGRSQISQPIIFKYLKQIDTGLFLIHHTSKDRCTHLCTGVKILQSPQRFLSSQSDGLHPMTFVIQPVPYKALTTEI